MTPGAFSRFQVVFYVACSCILFGVILLFTLTSAYGGSHSSSDSSRRGSEVFPLLDASRGGGFGRPGRHGHRGDEETAFLADEELNSSSRGTPSPDRSPGPDSPQCKSGKNHDRSKWLAHGQHSEVFQVVSLLKRTILKIVPVMGDLTGAELEALTLGIESLL
ncbi:unnamed protein product [Ixodes hexagonus]